MRIISQLVDTLYDFVECIEATGGVSYDGLCYWPVGDPTWSDLGAAYIRACSVLDRTPKVEVGERLEEYEEEE